ncbi:MAG: hypothetical protein JOY54_06455 [Acidobacteriaceae bacterium]|nr:hypothetical protein [Acidobacteriaceae bacterium]
MPSRKIEKEIEALNTLRCAGPTADVLLALRKALNERANLVVAKAAQIAAGMNCRNLLPDLAKAFERLFENPRKADPQCWGKDALAKSLKDLGYAESELFLRGMRHVQMEPVWGGEADTAVTLRGTCALALMQCRDMPREATLRVLLDALTDELSEKPERSAPVRIDAIRALEQMEGEEVILLLRLKAKLGDVDPAVTGQAFESLLRLEGTRSVEFVLSFLESEDEVREEAALALGASRLGSAVQALMKAWTQSSPTQADPVILRAISSSRTEAAIDFLLELVRTGCETHAIEALRALALHAGSPDIAMRVAEIVRARTEAAVQAEFHREFRQ